MFTTKNARRVVIVVDSVLQSQFLEKIEALGAHSYNLIECRGRGANTVTGDMFTRDDLSRIEVITSEKTATAILDYVHATQFSQFGRYALSAWMDIVEVDLRDKSLS